MLPVVELAYTGDLKSPAERHKGSRPFGETIFASVLELEYRAVSKIAELEVQVLPDAPYCRVEKRYLPRPILWKSQVRLLPLLPFSPL